jgi:hypothetical protein
MAAKAAVISVIRLTEKTDREKHLVNCEGPIAPRFESPELYNSYD